MVRKAGTLIIIFGLSVNIFSSVCLSIPSEDIISEQVAVVTEFPSEVEVTYWDISLWTDLPNNQLKIVASCTLHNKGKVPLDRLDFYLLGAEKLYGVEVKIAKIARLIGGKEADVTFKRFMEQEPKDPSQARTFAYPEVTRVFLSPVLNKGEECRLVFDYVITCVDIKRGKDDKLICELEKGKKETCLIADFAWFPLLMADLQKIMGLVVQKNFFPRLPKPSWRVTLTHPDNLQSMVIDGKLQKSEHVGEQTVSQWRSIVGGWPQVFIGPSERVEKSAEDVTVVFLLPRGKYNPEYVDALGDLVIHAYRVYKEWFGPLESSEVHIVATSGISAGHGAFLGMTVEASDFQRNKSNNITESGQFFTQTPVHELAHAWWGNSVSSYGRGTKFLRESLANFSAWHLAREHYGMDPFKSTLHKKIFEKGLAKKPLFNAESDERGFSYTKGPIVLDILRQEMGDEVFFWTLREFARRNRNAHVTFIDFVAICNEISRRDWMPFFYQWCYEKGCPAYHLVGFESKKGKGGWETKVKIRNDGEGIVRCPLELRMEGKRQEEVFWVQGGEERTFAYQTDKKVTDVVVNPKETAYQANAKEDR